MDKIKPFSQEKLNEIFKISPSDPERVISRESGNLEFKESFGWKSLAKYLKTVGAFANTRGGYIVFGVSNSPHKLVGLNGENLKSFEVIDSGELTLNLNNHFSPEIQWSLQEYELQGKTYGIIYVKESDGKPVICTKDIDKVLKEGDIYYRYRGRTERIKYPELRAILDEKRTQEQRLWMRHLAKIAKIGVQDTGIFDLQTGQITGTKNSFYIDESLLSQLSFIKEGQFSEVKGKPTLKVIGNAVVTPHSAMTPVKKQIVKTKGIRVPDIVQAFLNREKVAEPIEYIKQICFENTAFLPVYYFIDRARLDVDRTAEIVNSIVSRCPAKTKLNDRLRNKKTQALKIPANDNASTKKKKDYVQQIVENRVKAEMAANDSIYCLQAIRGMSPPAIKKNSTYLCLLLKTWFNKHYATALGPLADHIRRAICWVDEALYMKEV
jgi:hypothetical protein